MALSFLLPIYGLYKKEISARRYSSELTQILFYRTVFDFHTKFKCFLHKGDCVFLEALIKDNRF